MPALDAAEFLGGRAVPRERVRTQRAAADSDNGRHSRLISP